jgi:hypothetical protein
MMAARRKAAPPMKRESDAGFAGNAGPVGNLTGYTVQPAWRHLPKNWKVQ